MHESNNEMVIKKLLYQTLLFPLLLLHICSPILKKYLFIKKKHILEINKRFSKEVKLKKAAVYFLGRR